MLSDADSNKNYNLQIIKPGEFVGLSAVFMKNTFSYSSIAVTDCQEFPAEKDAIAKVVKQNELIELNEKDILVLNHNGLPEISKKG